MERLVHSEYFIDESGNTGDLSKVKIEAYFTEQRMFALAAIGCTLDEEFINKFNDLRATYRISGPEVKSSRAYDRPLFVANLLDLLETRHCPIFIEITDKHYFVVMNIIERMVIPYVDECDTQPNALWMKSVMADYMALYAPPDLAHAFAACCQNRDHTDIRDLYKRIINWAKESSAPPAEVAEGIGRFTRDSLKEFRKLPKLKAIENALPVPDQNPSGKLFWVLPNLTSFTHIYARINRYTKKRISGATLYHDEQLQFGDILRHGKKMTEGVGKLDLKLPLKTADFDFSETAALQFVRSHDCIGIQIADVVAGFIARYVQDAVWGGREIHPEKKAIFDRLVAMGNQSTGVGINFVAPDSLVRFLGVVPRPNY